jgi:hypothetical protein
MAFVYCHQYKFSSLDESASYDPQTTWHNYLLVEGVGKSLLKFDSHLTSLLYCYQVSTHGQSQPMLLQFMQQLLPDKVAVAVAVLVVQH